MFLAQPEDNNAVYRCEANNIMLQHPLSSEITLSVQCKFLDMLGSIDCLRITTNHPPPLFLAI